MVIYWKVDSKEISRIYGLNPKQNLGLKEAVNIETNCRRNTKEKQEVLL